MALVTPIQDVLDVLYDEQGELMKIRTQYRSRLGEQSASDITGDSTRRTKASPEDFTSEGLETASRRASRKTSKPAQGKKRTSG